MKLNNHKYLSWALIASTLIFSKVSASAAAFDLPDQDAFAIGRGMAFVATADNGSAIYYNPAGITQLSGQNVRAGLYGIYLAPTYKSPSGSEYNNQKPWNAVPQFYYTMTPENLPLSFGVGVYAPFGLGVQWPQDTGFRAYGTQGNITYVTVNPVVAWKISPSLSIGGGVEANYSQIDLRQGFTSFPGNDQFRFYGDGASVAFNAGVRWQMCSKWSVGATYRSGAKMDYSGQTHTYDEIPGDFNLSSSASGGLYYPQKVIAGISFRPTPNWNMEFNWDWTDWSQLGTAYIHQSDPAPGFPSNVPLVLNWQASDYFELGATHYFEHNWLVSAGYIYSQSSVPDANYNPIVADLDRQFVSAGVGYHGKRFDCDVAYQFGFAFYRNVTGAPTEDAPGPQTANGRYGFNSDALAVSVGWHF